MLLYGWPTSYVFVTCSLPSPTARATSNLPRALSGTSACPLRAYARAPIACAPVLHASAVIEPSGPSPTICSVKRSRPFSEAPRSVAAVRRRPTAALAVGARSWRSRTSRTSPDVIPATSDTVPRAAEAVRMRFILFR